MNIRFLVAGSALVAAASFAAPAEAALTFAAEAGPTVVLSPVGEDSRIGFGAAGRIGYSLGLPILDITPEVKIAVDQLPLGTDTKSLRAMVGARASLGSVLAPCVFVHFGVGSINPTIGDTSTGAGFDVGAGLDFTMIPFIDIGVFASYNRVKGDIAAEWVVAGVQATLEF